MDRLRMPDRRTARKLAYAAQAAVAGVLVLTTAVAALGVPSLEPRRVEAPEPPRVEADTQAGPTATTVARIDTEAVSFMLGSVKNRPTPPVVVETTAEILTEAMPSSANGEIRFLGGIIEPHRAVALLSLGGVQRMVPVGREYQGYRVLRVEPDHVVLSRGGDDIVVEKSDRHGSVVSSVTPRPGATNPANAMVMSQPGTEDPAALRARAAERAREEIARRRGDFDRMRVERGGQPEDQR
ncbi:MAG: hypothetical protein DYG93_07565 [Leptolyngbya sp. PLA2]|nr:hypothetical protein [Leptolyngbya sp.]MCE7971506.1 hypothetical protein [Leptolyngbya sp. PL-A2]MCQ3940721.1 hypothetical protein [cyanobacterium CYA1]MCZ7632283.1 hypothetical protein [Phycisphaerales bacterium]MDL1903690.1 hypothetical protein [Synechococcales cyanobacterium CNB]GIK18442.1 MAG: hypothetical protein BroJett004_06060 [Planctomycetota bacterium]